MKCPEDVQEIVAELLMTSLLRIRAAGWSGDAGLCAIEADHVHNLPALLSNFSPDLLRFYFNTEREAYLNQARSHAALSGAAADFRAFERGWKAMEIIMAEKTGAGSATDARQVTARLLERSPTS